MPFTDPEDFERGGNLPLDEAIELALADLEHFWTALFAESGQEWTPVSATLPIDPDVDVIDCGGEEYSGDILVGASFYCADTDTIYLDDVNLIPALYEIGDYAVATSSPASTPTPRRCGSATPRTRSRRNLQADCYAGLYAASGFTVNRGEEQILVLSPGDLDEAVIAFLLTSDDSSEVEAGSTTVGTAFQRFDAYRDGFISGVAACDAIRRRRG